jgi:hypothetical protein
METSVAEARGNNRTADDELDAYIARQQGKRLREDGPFDYEEQWRTLEAEHVKDRALTIRELWIRYHRQQSARMKATMQSIIHYHESELKKWEGE